MLGASEMEAQTRNRSLVAWGESLLGLNRPPELPAGVVANDVEAVTAGELIGGLTLRSGILVGGTNYVGSRLILRGPTALAGNSAGVINYGTGVLDHTDQTSWNMALQDASGRMGLNRVGFGHLFGAILRRPTNAPSPLASGRFQGQYPGDLAFFGDRALADLPATDADGAGGFVSVVVSPTHVVALRADGSVSAFGGDNLFGERLIPSGVVGAVEVAAGEFFSAALLTSGQVIVWGSDASGVVNVPASATNVVSLRAGALHLLALRADGTVVAWGNPSDGRTTVPIGLNRVIKIAAGRAHSLALRDDGTVVAWGYNGAGQTSVPSGLANVVDIAAGGQHNLVLVSRERPLLNPLSFREISSEGARDFNPISDYTDRGRSLSVRASLENGAPPVQFRWRRNGTLIPGATNSQLTVVVAPSEPGALRIDVEVVNAFGSDLKSATVRLADIPSEVVVEPVAWVPGVPPVVTTLGQSAAGVFLGVNNAGSQLAFRIRAKGDPVPRVMVYNSRTGDAVLPSEVSVTNASATVLGSAVAESSRPLTVANSGVYLVVLSNSLGKSVTNRVPVDIFPELLAPTVSTSISPNSAVPSYLGPILAGSTNLLLSVISSHGPGLTFNWLKDGLEIPRATNSILSFTNFNFSQIGTYSVRLSNPLSGSSLLGDRPLGVSLSAGFTPVLPITVTLSRTNLAGPTGSSASMEIQISGALHARVQLQRWDSLLGWSSASASFPVVAPALPAAWSPTGTYELDVSGGGGRASFSVGTASLNSTLSGNYRIRVVQLGSAGGTELAGTEQISPFQVSVTSAADIVVAGTEPVPVEGGGIWVSGAAAGVDMTVAAAAYSTVDLSSYLSVSGFPAPVFRWERQTEPASGSIPAKYQSLSVPTNSPRMLISAVATNAGIYRVTATNSLSGPGGVSRMISLRVDRVLRMPPETLAAPGGGVEIPIALVGFGDESAVSFTLEAQSPYILTDDATVTLTLDPSISSIASISHRRSGSLSVAPANGGVGGNRFKLQVLISRNDPSVGFPRGTNTLARLALQAQPFGAIDIIRNLGTSGVPVVPPLDVPVRVLKDVHLITADRDLSCRVAFTNATLAPMVTEGGQVAVLADSVEGDVNGTGSVDVLDITAIASVLASSVADTNPVVRRRMDCAPRASSGDWSINLADLVQVARFVAKLDPIQPAEDPATGGPGYSLNRSQQPMLAKSLARSTGSDPIRSIGFGWSDLVTGQEAWVPVLLDGAGNENAFAFNVEFDAQALEFIGLKAPLGTSHLENRITASQGRIGAVLWKPAGQSAPAGLSMIVEVGFRVRAPGGTTELRFGSSPVDSLIATVDAKPVQRVQYASNRLSIAQRRRVLGGRVVGQTLSGSEWRIELQAMDSGGQAVSARDRRLRVRTSDRLEAPRASWLDSGLNPEVTPGGTVRIPVSMDPARASGFFHLVEE
jgi:hypothetical protein